MPLRRFIPAPAGNSTYNNNVITVATVHPRACGEQATVELEILPDSPVHPRACGEQVEPVHCATDPTWVFNGSSPRLRGTGNAKASSVSVGSSPRLRGTVNLLRAVRIGSSPRLRGTASSKNPDSRTPVHPRACGEQTARGQNQRRITGSSPRLRGTAVELVTRRGL